MENNPETPIKVKIEDSQRNATQPDGESWIAHALKISQEQPNRIEEAAKFLSGTISISFAIFLQLNSDAFKSSVSPKMITWSIAFWLLSLVCTLFVIIPRKYTYRPMMVTSIKQAHSKLVNWKNTLLTLGILCFLIALFLTSLVYYQNNILSNHEKTAEQGDITIKNIKIFPSKTKKIDSIIIQMDSIILKK
jgi:hypothetical protein